MKRQGFTLEDVELLVEEAVGSIPDNFRRLLENVAIVVEEEPTEEDLDDLEDEDTELLGIYRESRAASGRAICPPALPRSQSSEGRFSAPAPHGELRSIRSGRP